MPLLPCDLVGIGYDIDSWEILPFTRKPCKPCVCFEPPTKAKVEVLIEDGVGAASTSTDILPPFMKEAIAVRVWDLWSIEVYWASHEVVENLSEEIPSAPAKVRISLHL